MTDYTVEMGTGKKTTITIGVSDVWRLQVGQRFIDATPGELLEVAVLIQRAIKAEWVDGE